jgi:hypothetical protein
MGWVLMLMFLAGCQTLPPRAGCLAGDVRYAWFSKTPRGTVVSSNTWCPDGQKCPAFKATVAVTEAGTLTTTCEPLWMP